jgi:hypothetical protein
MHANEPLARAITRNLDEAIDRLDQDLERVEIWTAALTAFLEPIPGYDSNSRFLLPGTDSGGEPAAGEAPERPFAASPTGVPRT